MIPSNSAGIWRLLYQQCIIWLALASFSEIPVVVFLILNLNDPWNEMMVGSALAMLSIGAARMYRSLCDRGSFIEYELSDSPRFPLRASNPTMQCRGTNVHGAMQFASVTQSEETQASVISPADQTHVEFVRSGLASSGGHGCTQDKANSAGYETVSHVLKEGM